MEQSSSLACLLTPFQGQSRQSPFTETANPGTCLDRPFGLTQSIGPVMHLAARASASSSWGQYIQRALQRASLSLGGAWSASGSGGDALDKKYDVECRVLEQQTMKVALQAMQGPPGDQQEPRSQFPNSHGDDTRMYCV